MSQERRSVKEVYPYIRVKGAPQAILFYQQVFGAKEIFRLTDPSGRIGHIELQLGNSILMLSEEFPEYGMFAPKADGSNGVSIHLHVDNADHIAKVAVKSGAEMLREPQDQFYGERSCTIRDPFGHEWLLGHEIEKVSYDEMQRRYNKMLEQT